MNILFLTTGKLDSIDDKGIYSDLMREFRNNGHNVYVVSPREKKLKLPTEYTTEKKVNFLKVRIGNLTRTNLIEKGISTIRIEQQFLKEIKRYLNNVKFDLIIYSTPPITFSKVIDYIKKRDGSRSYLLLKDIFPQNAVDLKMFSINSPIYYYFKRKEKKLYHDSDYIGCMSEANVAYILRENINLSKKIVEICPNTIEPQTIKIEDLKKQQIKTKYGVPLDKTIFIYGGNLGKPQGIDFLIECIKVNEYNKKPYILVVGSGTEYNKLNSYFENSCPKNSKLLKQLSKNDYEILANSCDVGLVFLDRRFTIPNFPSRVLSYMQAAMPILAATDINTDIGETITEGNFGYWCESKKAEDFNKLVNKLCDDKLRTELGVNARKYLENNYTSKHSYEIIMKHFV